MGAHISDADHCRVALRRLAKLHAISSLIQRDSESPLVELFPFMVDAAGFAQRFKRHTQSVRTELAR